MSYTTIEEIEKDFKIVAYGHAGQPFRFWEMHLIKNEDIEKTKQVRGGIGRYTAKVLPIRTKGVPKNEKLFDAANNYTLTAVD